MSYISARKEVMVIKEFQVPIDIWNDKNIPMEAKYIYSYIYSKSYKKYLVDINIGEIQQVIKIKNKGLRNNLKLLNDLKYLVFNEYAIGNYSVTLN